MLLATQPSEPMGLAGGPAGLWHRLVAAAVPDSDLNADDRALVREFEAAGIASRDVAHPARVHQLNVPWLSSPVHEMVYSLVGSIARDHGIDAVCIKGPMLHRQGLREREHSSDVDVWVDPARLEQLCSVLESWGWNGKADQWTGLTFNHSVALEPRPWGCEIDVHRHVPGCSESDPVVFARLLRGSVKTDFAGVPVLTPDLPTHAVIFALHDLRPESRHSKASGHAEELAEILRLGGRPALEFSQDVRATAVLEPSLRLAFPEVSFAVDHEPPLNWRWRESKGWWRAYMMIFRSLQPRERLRFIKRAVWPQADVLAASEARAGRSTMSLVGARFRRFGKLLRR
ncbi:nucleotidyltransferase family protein [Paenarthrobacter sp. NPDC090520]|uniref:nucleotidyltransferase family protein n=1 Tax=Paenarthrobacter sp. NPDC090520 TaxID=3364382 RepID=UPI003819ACAA